MVYRASLLPLLCTSVLALGCANKDTTTASPTEAAGEPTPDASSDPMSADKDIVEVAIEAGNFTTLATALEKAGLVETLQSEGPFTVFAPTDEAFAALPEGTLDELLANPEQLKKVLLYHVVEGKVMSSDVAGLSEATAVSGSNIPIDTSNGVVVAGATVTTPDIEASNGVIHVVDSVMLPPE